MEWTYFIADDQLGRIKIGTTNGSAEARRRALQVGSPSPLVLLGVVHGNQEERLHAEFDEDRKHGEWFNQSERLIEFIRTHAIPQPDLLESYERSELQLSGPASDAVIRLERRRDGTWTFILRIDGEALLPDGRRIRVSRHVGIPANEQIGRKRPA